MFDLPLFIGAASGAPAIVTAIGGVCVSLATVYFNNRKQVIETTRNADHIQALTGQIALLASQVSELKGENASLKVEIKLLREQLNK